MITFTCLMFWVLVGHFVGDYLLQSKKMALTKSARGWSGLKTCLKHCWLYTLAVYVCVVTCLGLWASDKFGAWLILPMVFLTHFPIDRWSLADRWLKLICGRQLDEIFKEAAIDETDSVALRKTFVADFATRQAFTALVYTVVDNTLHFLLMAAGFAVLWHYGVLS